MRTVWNYGSFDHRLRVLNMCCWRADCTESFACSCLPVYETSHVAEMQMDGQCCPLDQFPWRTCFLRMVRLEALLVASHQWLSSQVDCFADGSCTLGVAKRIVALTYLSGRCASGTWVR